MEKGLIIPTMPVMQYIHEKKDYPIGLEVFPGDLNKEATFTLYEDDGESRDYEKNIFSKTKFNLVATKTGFNLTVDTRRI